MFNWPHWLYGCWMSHSALCVLTAHSLSAIYPKISGKCTSVTQVYSACFPVDTTTLVTLRNVDQSVQSYFKQESRKQEMAFKGYHLNSAASLLSLRLGGYTRTSGWPAKPPIMNRASLTAICLGEQLSVLVSLQEYAGFKYIICDSTFLSIHTIKQ